MKIKSIPLENISLVREPILTFIRRYGENRITHRVIRWIKKLNGKEKHPGTIIVAALQKKRLIGVSVFGRYGIVGSLIVVHPKYRKQGVGEALLQHILDHLPKVYARVAIDNIPSLRLCFSSGFVAYHLFYGPTGKPTLWLGAGEWSREELPIEKSVSQQTSLKSRRASQSNNDS